MFDPKYTPPAYKGRYAETEAEAARWLEDKDNNRPPPELLPRDVVARAIYREVLAGRGTEHGGVYLDVTHRGADFIRRKLPSMYEQFHALGDVDITTQPMEVYPTIHYTMGGVRAEPETCATNVPGLYAAGETAAGVHGANRLGGNALCDILVFGRRAGEGAAAYAKTVAPGALDEAMIEAEAADLVAPFASAGRENPYLLTQELQAVMQEGAMIARTEEGLQGCLQHILALQERARQIHVDGTRMYNPGWHTARDIRNMLTVSEIIVRCALERRESRGAQWRLDYPNPDPAWAKKNLVATEGPSGVWITTVPVEEMPPELAALFETH
jgi:succinate dehydrogenase / fumarate reductase flavoprotein subunit